MTKTFLIAAVATAALFGAASTAEAARTTGKVELKGSVATVCEVTVTDLKADLNLTRGEKGKKVASVEEHCNDHDGYTITFDSSNNGSLKSKDNDRIAYTVNYDNQSRKSLNNDLTLRRNSAQFRKNHDLFINIDASNTRVAGDYSDSITVEIRAK
ncbi:MAG: spore coat protein U domain-containing protein [Alphaproteobacteria bacterium]